MRINQNYDIKFINNFLESFESFGVARTGLGTERRSHKRSEKGKHQILKKKIKAGFSKKSKDRIVLKAEFYFRPFKNREKTYIFLNQ